MRSRGELRTAVLGLLSRGRPEPYSVEELDALTERVDVFLSDLQRVQLLDPTRG